MREILFKAKRKDNGEWVEGWLIKGKWYFDESEIFAILPTDLCIYPHCEFSEWIEIDKETICQYTGLTDKNGNKIWENDVVKCVDVNIDAEFYAVVEFGNPNGYYSWGYQLKHISGDEPNLDILLWVDMEVTGAFIEVIGNVFDNSELLGG